MRKLILVLPLIFMLSFVPSKSWAQTNKSSHFDFAVTVGPLLNENLPGIRQILHAYSASISKGVYSFRPEFSFMHARSEGDIFYMAMLSIRNSYVFDDLEPFWNIGLDYTYYRPTANGMAYSYRGQGGWHYGGGTFIKITPNVRLRAEVLGRNRPGKALYVGVGLSYSFQSTDKTGQEEPR